MRSGMAERGDAGAPSGRFPARWGGGGVPAALFVAIVIAAALTGSAGAQLPRKTLGVYFIDVEGGQSTLFVTPSGESLLVDAGWPGLGGRDAGRISAVATGAGLARIDYLVVSHYHTDHVGGVPELAARIPIRTFVDHGPSFETGERADALYGAYVDTRKKGRHLLVKPGDRIPIADLDVRVVSAGGELLRKPLAGAGGSNPLCAAYDALDEDATENARSVGLVVTFGRFRMLDLGDLTWNKEHDLVCPNNLLGTVDLYLVTHHGLNISGPPALVHAVKPRVAVMNNGARKGGTPSAWRIVRESPGLQDLWQLHAGLDAGPQYTSPAQFVANPDEATAFGVAVTVERDGRFTVSNQRNGYAKTYAPR